MTRAVAELVTPTEAEIVQAKESSHQLARLLPKLEDELTLQAKRCASEQLSRPLNPSPAPQGEPDDTLWRS